MKKKFIDSIMDLTKLTESEVSKIAMDCGQDKQRTLKFARMHMEGISLDDILKAIKSDNYDRENATILSLESPGIEVYQVLETMQTIKAGTTVEAIDSVQAIVSAEIQIFGNKEYRAKEYLILVNPFGMQSLIKILRASYHKNKEGQLSTVIVCGEGTPWSK